MVASEAVSSGGSNCCPSFERKEALDGRIEELEGSLEAVSRVRSAFGGKVKVLWRNTLEQCGRWSSGCSAVESLMEISGQVRGGVSNQCGQRAGAEAKSRAPHGMPPTSDRGS